MKKTLERIKPALKKITFYLQHFDGIWSVPLAFMAFWFIGIILQFFGGYGTGTYDAGFIQPLFLAAAVVIGATNVAVLGMFFTFRGLYHFLYGQKKAMKDKDGNYPKDADGNNIEQIVNYSKIKWTNLTAFQQFAISLFVFFYFLSSVLFVYLKLV